MCIKFFIISMSVPTNFVIFSGQSKSSQNFYIQLSVIRVLLGFLSVNIRGMYLYMRPNIHKLCGYTIKHLRPLSAHLLYPLVVIELLTRRLVIKHSFLDLLYVISLTKLQAKAHGIFLIFSFIYILVSIIYFGSFFIFFISSTPLFFPLNS